MIDEVSSDSAVSSMGSSPPHNVRSVSLYDVSFEIIVVLHNYKSIKKNESMSNVLRWCFAGFQ